MTSTLLIFQIVLSLVITVAVLLQKSSSIGLGAYSGSNETMFGAKGPAGFLAKFTFSVAILFIVNTLALGYFYNQENSKSVVSKINSDVPSAPVTSNNTPTTTAPTAPTPTPTKVEESTKETPVAKPTPTEEPKKAVETNNTTVTPTTEAVTPPTVENNTSNESNASN